MAWSQDEEDIYSKYRDLNYTVLLKVFYKYCQNIIEFCFVESNYSSCICSEQDSYSDYELGLLFKKNSKICSIKLGGLVLNGDCFLGLNADKITELKLINCNFTTKNHLDFIVELKNLKKFQMQNHSCDTREIIETLNRSNCENILEFDVSSMYNLLKNDYYALNYNELLTLFSKQKKLYKLHLPKTRKTTINFVKNLPANSIQDLIMYFDEHTSHFFDKFVNLESFECQVDNLTDQCLENLSKCVNLKKIDIKVSEKYLLTANGVNYFSKFKKLESFKFSCVNSSSINLNNLLKALSQCENLENLNLRDFYELKDDILNNVCLLSNLTSLNIYQIPELQLLFIVHKLQKLNKIYFSYRFISLDTFEIMSILKVNRKDNHCLEIYLPGYLSSFSQLVATLKENKMNLDSFPLILIKPE